jgi:hypothetical protein
MLFGPFNVHVDKLETHILICISRQIAVGTKVYGGRTNVQRTVKLSYFVIALPSKLFIFIPTQPGPASNEKNTGATLPAGFLVEKMSDSEM